MHTHRLTHPTVLGLAAVGLLTLTACAPSLSPRDLPSMTRVASVDTATAPPMVPPSPTPTRPPAATDMRSPSATPRPATATASVAPVVRLMAVGDIMLARTVGDRIQADGPHAPFARVVAVLETAELLAANLECVIGDGGQPVAKAYTFRAPAAAAAALASAGVDVVSLANNHALDYGVDGLNNTLRLLGERGILSVGTGMDEATARAPVIVSRNALRVAFLAYVDVPVESRSGFDTRVWTAGAGVPGVAWADLDHITSDVASARTQADVVVVMLHFGLEGRTEPTTSQRSLARAAIDAGAALVLGSHPHVLQAVEQYGGGLIAYSLGNFVFDGFTPPETLSAVFTATLTREGVAAYDWIPVVIEDGLPRLAAPEEATGILARVEPTNSPS